MQTEEAFKHSPVENQKSNRLELSGPWWSAVFNRSQPRWVRFFPGEMA
jgi:hypothetical protein